MFTVIRFTLINRKTKAIVPCWIAKLSYADGPGMKVKRMYTTRDREKAARFSLETAHLIAGQFSQFPATLEKADGTALPAETVKLQTAQREAHARAQANVEDINAVFADAFASLGLENILTSTGK